MAASVEKLYLVHRHGMSANIPLMSNWVTNHVLVASTAQAITPPAGATIALFSFDADIWVNFQETTVAAIPSVDDTDGNAAVLNPGSRSIGATGFTTSFSIISAIACKGSIEWYS